MFGIAWGVGSLLLLVGVGEGFRSGNRREMAEFGRDIMFIFPGRAPAVAGSMNSAQSYLLTYHDYLDIRRAGHVRNAAPMISRSDLHEVSEFATGSGEIIGTEPQLNEISYLPLKEGRWLNAMDGDAAAQCDRARQRAAENAIPRSPGGGFIHPDQRNQIRGGRQRRASWPRRQYVAQHARLYSLPGDGDVFPHQGREPPELNFIRRVSAAGDRRACAGAEEECTRSLRRNHGFDANDQNAFDGWDSIQESKMVRTIFDVMNVFLGAVGMVTLGLGAIGVINIMLVAVSERTHEIGLRKALGATNRNILLHFFLEGLLLTLGSGLIGMVFAGVLMALMGTVQGREDSILRNWCPCRRCWRSAA